MDIRTKTCVIIRKTRNIEKAREVARKTGGVTVLFNPIVKQMRVI